MGISFFSLFSVVAAPASADLPPLPSGAEARFFEALQEQREDGAVLVRMRYVMPQIARDATSPGAALDFAAVEGDFKVLCETHALPALKAGGLSPETIVVSLSDRETEFGVADPDATQFFEAFTVDGDLCIWEVF